MNYRERPGRVGPSFISGALAGLVVGTLQLGCGGGLSADESNGTNPPGTGTGGSSGIIGGGNGGSTVITQGCTGCVDPGTKAIHRLNDAEYNATVQDLFDDPALAPARGWLPGEVHGFDNIADSLHVNDAQFEKYFNAAADIANGAFARADQLAKWVICADGTPACAQSVIEAMGLRVWRRPLLPAELTTMMGIYDRAVAQGLDHTNAVKELLKAFLTSPEFLYRIEFDADPTSAVQHDISQYDLATRMSYFLWSSTPDDELLQQAGASLLSDPATLSSAIDRMLQSPKSNRLVMNFAGQWLDIRGVPGHRAFPDKFPDWSPELGASMATEAYSFFSEFLHSDLPWTDFLRADFNYVDSRLAAHYGMTDPGAGVVRVVDTADARMGFLGLGAFLTSSSYPQRTSPTSRARRILSDLLCTPPPEPPPAVAAEVAQLLADEEANQGSAADASQDIKAFLEQHRTDPGCAACHAIFDPYGMALENFDGIGKWRTAYPSGTAIDGVATLTNGTVLNGLPGLVETISPDPRLTSCVTDKLFIYALGRGMVATDTPYLDAIKASWTSGSPTLKRLAHELVLSAPFRTRHGGF
jgi:hypothetical protein